MNIRGSGLRAQGSGLQFTAAERRLIARLKTPAAVTAGFEFNLNLSIVIAGLDTGSRVYPTSGI